MSYKKTLYIDPELHELIRKYANEDDITITEAAEDLLSTGLLYNKRGGSIKSKW